MFKERRRKLANKRIQEGCFHEWRVADFSTSEADHLGLNEVYTIRCVKCGKTRKVDKYAHREMKKRGMFE